MLPHLYKDFSKDFFAKFAMDVVKGAEQGDALSKHVMDAVSERLARHLVPVARKISPVLRQTGVRVVCEGSVWKSWPLLKPMFDITLAKSELPKYVKAAEDRPPHLGSNLSHSYPRNRPPPTPSSARPRQTQFVRLKAGASVGAAVMGAKEANLPLTVDFDANVEVLFTYT